MKSGFIDGDVLSNLDTDEDVHVKCLTWHGHELLDTIRSKPVCKRALNPIAIF